MGGKHWPNCKGMSMDLVSWPSTPLLRQALLSIEYKSTYSGRDENENPIFDKTKKLPTLTYRGTVKVHGMNCSAVVRMADLELQAQSRNLVLSEAETCNGFYGFLNEKEKSDYFLAFSKNLNAHFDKKYNAYAFFGEWAGQSIQKKVAVSKVPRFFMLFGVIGIDSNGEKTQLDENLIYLMMKQIKNKPNAVYHSLDFPSFIFELDFNKVQDWLPKLSMLVAEIEKSCPVGLHFGEEGTGEGLVFKCLTPGWEDSRYWFKLKGEKHKVSKDTTVNEDKIQLQSSVQSFVDYSCTENRLEQGIDMVFGQKDQLPTKDKVADFLRWIVQDILKEESDTLEKSSLSSKDVTKAISAKARKWYLEKF